SDMVAWWCVGNDAVAEGDDGATLRWLVVGGWEKQADEVSVVEAEERREPVQEVEVWFSRG
ncbi:hypothetical protein U1Q18_046784, partial [Sarracenia purpurea var. burkii]